jgi:hypothetical protein
MRLKTNGVCCGRRSRVVLMPRRWHQVCGRQLSQATVANKPGRRGEHEISRKTIARGMPGDFRCDRGDYARVLCFYRTRGCGRGGRPAFPAPSEFRGQTFWVKLAWMRGEIAKLCLRTTLFENRIRGNSLSATAPLSASSPRKRGPITTLVGWSRSRQPPCQTRRHGVWVPAFAGTTLRDHASLCGCLRIEAPRNAVRLTPASRKSSPAAPAGAARPSP